MACPNLGNAGIRSAEFEMTLLNSSNPESSSENVNVADGVCQPTSNRVYTNAYVDGVCSTSHHYVGAVSVRPRTTSGDLKHHIHTANSTGSPIRYLQRICASPNCPHTQPDPSTFALAAIRVASIRRSQHAGAAFCNIAIACTV
jgi:hypothetical protein